MSGSARTIRLVALVFAFALVAAACGGTGGETTTTAATTTTSGSVETTTTQGGGDTTTTEAAPAVPKGKLTVGASNALITFDIHQSQAGSQLQFLEPMFDPLIRDLPNGELAPGLATEWSYNDDRTELTLTIREGVTFHDGAELTAQVVADNLIRARDLAGPRAAGLAVIDSAETTGPSTVVLSLTAPAPALLNDLSNAPGYMISPNQLEGTTVEEAPIGTGGWIYDADSSVVGERYFYHYNPDYWDPASQGIAEIEVIEMPDDDARMNALLDGQIDMAIIRAPQAAQAEASGLVVVSSPERWYGLLLSDRDGEVIPELGDVRVRQAMNHAVDREAIVAATQFGLASPTAQIFAPGAMGHDPDLESFYSYDPDRARDLLAEAGVSNLTIPTVTLGPLASVTEAIDGYLRDVGLQLDIQVLEPGTLGAAARSVENPTATFAYGQPDPDQQVTGVILPTAPYNPFMTTNEEIERLAAEGAAGDTFEERDAAYRELSRVLLEEAWFLVVYFGDVIAAHSPSVMGAEFHLNRGFAPVSYLGVTVSE